MYNLLLVFHLKLRACNYHQWTFKSISLTFLEIIRTNWNRRIIMQSVTMYWFASFFSSSFLNCVAVAFIRILISHTASWHHVCIWQRKKLTEKMSNDYEMMITIFLNNELPAQFELFFILQMEKRKQYRD